MVAATLVLNWHEDGMIYRTRLRSMRKNSTGGGGGGGGGTANNANSVAPMRLNPVIRCLRLMLVLAFVAIDVGLTLWEVAHYYFANLLKRQLKSRHRRFLIGLWK